MGYRQNRRKVIHFLVANCRFVVRGARRTSGGCCYCGRLVSGRETWVGGWLCWSVVPRFWEMFGRAKICDLSGCRWAKWLIIAVLNNGLKAVLELCGGCCVSRYHDQQHTHTYTGERVSCSERDFWPEYSSVSWCRCAYSSGSKSSLLTPRAKTISRLEALDQHYGSPISVCRACFELELFKKVIQIVFLKFELI